jgi:hypothetical protein
LTADKIPFEVRIGRLQQDHYTMKHDELRSVAHNAAASLAGGCSFLIGIYNLDVLAAASQSPKGELIVDFLRGTISGAPPSSPLAKAVAFFPNALPAFFEKHGISASAFNEMTARYWATPQGIRFTVRVVDQSGQTTETDYGDYNGQRTKELDAFGRLRPKSIRRT